MSKAHNGECQVKYRRQVKVSIGCEEVQVTLGQDVCIPDEQRIEQEEGRVPGT